MGVTVATVRVAAETDAAPNDQTITTTDCGGLTPVAAMFIITRAISDGIAADHACMGIGYAVSSTERLVVAVSDKDIVGTSTSNRRATEDECVMILGIDGGAIDGEADFKEFVTNGCTITWGDEPAAAYLLTVIFFCGTDVSAHVDTATSPAANNTATDVTDPGFEPDIVFTISHRLAWNDTPSVNTALSIGCAVNTAGDENYSINMSGAHAQAFAANTENNRSNRVLKNIYRSNLYGAADITGFDASGFDLYTRESDNAAAIGYLALSFNGAASVWLGDISSPTSIGNDAETNPGFTPQAVIVGIGREPGFHTVNEIGTIASVYSVGLGVTTTNVEYSNVISSEDPTTDMNTQSMSDDQLINAPEHDGGVAADLQATGPPDLGSFDANGFTLNYTQVDGSNNISLWALAIEETEGAEEDKPPQEILQPKRDIQIPIRQLNL